MILMLMRARSGEPWGPSSTGTENNAKPSSLLDSCRAGAQSRGGGNERRNPRADPARTAACSPAVPRHGTARSSPAGADLGRGRIPSVGVVDSTDRGGHGAQLESGPPAPGLGWIPRDPSVAQLAYVWGGRALRAVAPRSDSANFPGFFSILCSVFRDSVVTIFRVLS